ncbi:MAG: helix-turn-helix domain-containing protein [Candidatus Hydrogenedens sp.]
MARIKLVIQQPINEFTLKMLIEAYGYVIVNDSADVLITDDYSFALRHAENQPTLVLASAQQIPQAVELMRQGVYGYIFIPFQPDEVAMMIQRALGQWKTGKTMLEKKSVTLMELETETILKTLAECHFNRSETARRLGIGRNTLWRKLKKMKLKDNST